MSAEAILDAIEASGETEIAHLRAGTEARAQQILEEAERKAATIREQARRAALRPAAGERARRLHQAKLEALRSVGEVRTRLVEEALTETRQRLAGLRAEPDYPLILRRLVEEAIHALGDEKSDGSCPVLEIDPHDDGLLRRILDEPGPDLPIVPSLKCCGGVVARSGDGRIVVTNTLETRLERATPFLRRDLAAFFEKEQKEQKEKRELTPVPSVP